MERIRILKYDLPFRKGYKPQFTKDVFKIVAISSKKPPTYTIKVKQDEIILGKFQQTQQNNSVGREETFLQTLLINHVK